MKVRVRTLYRNGKPIPRKITTAVFSGDLIISDQFNPMLQRTVREARLFGVNGLHEINPMIDVQITTMSSDGFFLRGFEYLAHQEVAQEWWIRPVPVASETAI